MARFASNRVQIKERRDLGESQHKLARGRIQTDCPR